VRLQAQFAVDAQATFDRALAKIAGAKKWASAWNSDGAITQSSCETTMVRWMAKGANPKVSLQPLARAFLRKARPPPSEWQFSELRLYHLHTSKPHLDRNFNLAPCTLQIALHFATF
jgi:hypothetical protein